METAEYYNWSDLEVGRFDLNHSERFFAKKHQKHEKLNGEVPDLILTMEDKENKRNIPKNNCQSPSGEGKNKSKCDEQKTPSDKQKPKAIRNLRHQPFNIRAKSPIEKVLTKSAPSVYKYVEVYEKRKQELMRRLCEEERKNRIFHSKPAPKFNNLHEQKKKPQSDDCVKLPFTIPVTPLVLKKSKEFQEKQKQKLEEYNKRNKPQRFVSRDAHVLHEEPFKPKKTGQVVKPEPFNLHVEKRLEERKQYDENLKKSLEEKKKQDEEERNRREEEIVRELRKLTTFKARPNPFK